MIRLLHPADFDELLEIEAQAFPKSRYDRGTFWSLQQSYPETFLVAESDKLDGYMVFSPDGHIISMAVAPERRRCGIGSRLIHEAAEYCAGKKLRLEVRLSNVTAQRFYHSLGFRLSGRVQGYYLDGEDALLMERPATAKNG